MDKLHGLQKADLLALADPLLSHDRAQNMLAALEAMGFTIYRKKVMRNGRVPTVATPMTDELRKMIVELRGQGMAQQQIAAALNINHGRVAETLRAANQ